MSAELDQNIARQLSPEELEAISQPEFTEAEVSAIRRIAGEADDDEDPIAGGDETADDDEDPPASGQDADSGSAEAVAVDDGPVDAFSGAPRYVALLPENFQTRLQDVESAEAAVWQKFESGEIEMADVRPQLADIARRRDELSSARIKAEISQEMNQQSAEQSWRTTVNAFVDQAAKPNGDLPGIDYRADAAKQRDLDLFVKALAGDDANADKPMAWFLEQAHQRVQALHGVARKVAPDPAPADTKKPAGRKPDLSALPKTLSQVPGSGGPGDISGEFSDIESLDGFELEDAIARMSKGQRERFIKAA